jgi:acyl-CoA synthetase (AMP-forming)/AMP-acid ligase II
MAPEGARWDLSSMKAFINCSEPCKGAAFDRFLSRFAASGVTADKLQVCYALAENVFAATQTPLGRPAARLSLEAEALSQGEVRPAGSDANGVEVLSCGRPVDGVSIYIYDDRRGPAKPGRIGEICLRSPFLFQEYYRLPEATRERLRDGWYFTGDMGFMHEGELFVTGRRDDMIVVNGRNFYAHEIEAIVNAAPSVLPGRSVAVGVDDGVLDATVLVVLAEYAQGADAAKTARDIRDAVFDRLGVSVHAVVPLPAGKLVKTTSGKISRKMNKTLYLQGAL